MSQVFDENGRVVPVTLIEAGPCWVTQIKTSDKDGYEAVQLGFEEKKNKQTARSQQGHFKKSGFKRNFRYMCEFKDDQERKVGEKIDVSVFQPGETIKIAGISKGKGFQGVVKRHGFKGGPASHGQKHTLRAPGSIGSSFPERVWKGKKMAGHMGVKRVTVKNLKVVRVNAEDNVLAVKGAVPGRKGTLLEVVVTKEVPVKREKE